MTEQYIVMEASAQVPSSWKWRGGPKGYRKIALVMLTPKYALEGLKPKMISERDKGVLRVLRVWDRLHQGKTARSEYAIALREANDMADALNGKTVANADLAAALDRALLGRAP